MRTDPVQQYYKCPVTGVEMSFRKDTEFGWCISFPNGHDGMKLLKAKGLKIPFPELSPEEQKVVDDNYKRLDEMMGRESNN